MRTLDFGKAQVPRPGEHTLDHIAHFVPEIEAAAAALDALGFTLTPFSAQSHRLTPGGPLVPAGSGNRCVMLEHGYLEFLTPTADTPIANQLRSAIARYIGVHLVAFGTAAPERDHARLDKERFAPLEPVALQRQIDIDGASATARFTLVRVPPGTMKEGRIQFCEHHTPELLWQQRWLSHRNRVSALTGVILCVADLEEAAERYARFTGLAVHRGRSAWHIATARGYVLCTTAQALHERLNIEAPTLPWIAGEILTTNDLAAAESCARAARCSMERIDTRLLVRLPPPLGGLMMFQGPGADLLRFP